MQASTPRGVRREDGVGILVSRIRGMSAISSGDCLHRDLPYTLQGTRKPGLHWVLHRNSKQRRNTPRGTVSRVYHKVSRITAPQRRCASDPCLRNLVRRLLLVQQTSMRTRSYLKQKREASTHLRPCKSHEDVGAPSQKSLEVEF